MLSSLFGAITNFIIHVISQTGYAGVVLLMAIESAAIPLPSEIIMPFAGYLAGSGRFNLFLLALAGGAGSAVGSAVTYWIGRYGGRPLVERYGRYLFISEHDLDLADKFFARFGIVSTFLGRLLPVVRTFVSIPAGIAKVRFVPFIVFSFAGSVLWSLLLAYFGLRLGAEWPLLRERIHGFDYAVAALLALGVVWWIYRHFRRRSKA